MKFVFFLTVLIAVWASQAYGQGPMTGMMAPDPMKTCISLRLPWHSDPMYFCIEKEKFKYRNKCPNPSSMMNCGGMDMEMRTDTLLIKTPWDCCPYHSVPDDCMNMQCPPMPMNRKCQMMENKMMMGNGGDCCPKYFCEEGMTREMCHMKRRDPTCVNPPQGKMNCVGFVDQHGCCTKYHCHGDEGKPGMCPMHHQAMQFIMRSNTTHQMMMMKMNMSMIQQNMMHKHNMMQIRNMMQNNTMMHQHNMMHQNNMMHNNANGMMMQTGSYEKGMSMMSQMKMDCIGDFNCPESMKCCSHDMNTYGDGFYMMKNSNPIVGHCAEPMMTMPTMV